MPNWFWVSVCLACFRPRKKTRRMLARLISCALTSVILRERERERDEFRDSVFCGLPISSCVVILSETAVLTTGDCPKFVHSFVKQKLESVFAWIPTATMPSPRLRLQLINQQSPTNAAKVAQAPKNPKPKPKPKSGLKLRLNVQRWRRLWRAQRSTTSSTTTTIHFYYVWSVASSGISFAKPRKKENRQTTTSPLKPMAQNKATPDAVQTRREGRESEHIGRPQKCHHC